MPESAKDRPVSSYEHVFLLAKRERYFFDADAIREAGSINRLYVAQPAGENGRNCRDVWRINPKQFQGAHFAVMPLELAERCVLAGTSERGCCAACGAPWCRVTEDTDEIESRYKGNFLNAAKTAEYQGSRSQQGLRYRCQTVGWQPSCRCIADVIPCTVLDMFGGVGTTAHAALKHGRDAILIELNADYIRLAEQRLAEYLDQAIRLGAA
jgi:hypothetical protein